MTHLLIVEDDALLRDALADQLRQAAYVVDAVPSAEDAQALLAQTRVDALLLDLGLPGLDGLGLLRWLRQRQPALPVLILTARDGVTDRVDGLEAGADDYLTKPFAQRELLARLAALLRRARLPAFGGSLACEGPSQRRLRVDAQHPLAWLDDTRIELTPREWALLSLLVTRAGQVISREDVLGAWQATPAEGAAGSNALEVYIHRLRRKLDDSGLSIRNVRGLGYLLEASPPTG